MSQLNFRSLIFRKIIFSVTRVCGVGVFLISIFMFENVYSKDSLARPVSPPSPKDSMTDHQLRNLFDKVNNYVLSDLGPQCLQSKKYAELLKTFDIENIISHGLSYPEFLRQQKELGNLDEEFFKNPKEPEVSMTSAIESIQEGATKFSSMGWMKNPKYCGLNQKEFFSLLYYTGEGYRMLNRASRTEDEDVLNKLREIGQQLTLALWKLDPYVGWVKRGENIDNNPKSIEKLRSRYREGQIETFKAFTSNSIGVPFPGNVQIIAYVRKDCRYVADFSMVETELFDGNQARQEEEVLCMANTSFKVLRNKLDSDGVHRIILEEVELPNP